MQKNLIDAIISHNRNKKLNRSFGEFFLKKANATMQLNLVIHLLIYSNNICAQHKHMSELSLEVLHIFYKH